MSNPKRVAAVIVAGATLATGWWTAQAAAQRSAPTASTLSAEVFDPFAPRTPTVRTSDTVYTVSINAARSPVPPFRRSPVEPFRR